MLQLNPGSLSRLLTFDVAPELRKIATCEKCIYSETTYFWHNPIAPRPKALPTPTAIPKIELGRVAYRDIRHAENFLLNAPLRLMFDLAEAVIGCVKTKRNA